MRTYLDDYPNLRPDPDKCGCKSGHYPQLADFPCILLPEHEGPHQDKFGYQWNQDGSRIKRRSV